MTLSIIIVNYNVKHFLEHCLYAVQKAITGIDAEVIVVDNNSQDGSVNYLRPFFPGVAFIETGKNLGFGRANNLGLQTAKGKYVLFLNPDTLIQEDTLHKCLSAFEADEKIGAVGVRMIDGSGKFLKESKRSFPSPVTSLYKLFGFSALFPRSPVFSKYHLGHLSERANHEVDVLAGAFLMTKKSITDKTGGFDEDFFMYGEDIDLSFRIQAMGYKNLYLAATTILHFKGESTNRGSLNYVKMFYRAMEVFAKKHYGGTNKSVFIFLLKVGIWLRAFLSVIAKFVKKINAFSPLNNETRYRSILVAGTPGELESIIKILKLKNTGQISVTLANDIRELKALQKQTRARQIVFCTESFDYKHIFPAMGLLPKNLRYLFYNHTSKTIISSRYKNKHGAFRSLKKVSS